MALTPADASVAAAAADLSLPRLALDHLVVAARSLDEAAAWCEATLGVAPEGGGRHVGIGTHNRLLRLSGAAFPRCYLELIAIDPQQPEPAARRWFDLDDPALQAELAQGPTLVHWVARTTTAATIDGARAALAAAGADPGPVAAAGRDTPRGRLSWRITRRADGARPAGGAVPSIIEWGDVHPVDAMPAVDVALLSLTLGGPNPLLPALAGAVGAEVDARAAAPALFVRLVGLRGGVGLASPCLGC